MAPVRFVAQASCVRARTGRPGGYGRRRTSAGLLIAGVIVLGPAAGAAAFPVLAADDAVTTQGVAVTVRVLRNDSTDDSTRPLLPDSVRLGAGVPGSRAVVGSGRRTLDLPGVGTYQVLAGGSVRFTPDPEFVGDPEPVRYSVQDVGGARVGEYLRVRVVAAPQVDPTTEAQVQAAIDGDVGASGSRTAPPPPEVAFAPQVAGGTGIGAAELPRTGLTGSAPAAWVGVLLVLVGALLRRLPAQRPVHR